jgi:hypothetical protein
MHEALRYFIEKVVTHYSIEKYYDELLKAKEFYFKKTGEADEDDPNFESRMSSFNDWYVLEYKPEGSENTLIQQYIKEHNVVEDLVSAVGSFEHSIYEFKGKSFGGRLILKDLLNENKIKLAVDHSALALVKGDLFLGRVASYGNEVYMFNGLCLLPRSAKKLFKKQAKRVRKSEEESAKLDFLYLTEALKTKWLSYGHVNVEKIFVYDDFMKY